MALPGNLPQAVWNAILSLCVPEDRYEFLGHRSSRDAVWARNPMATVIRILWRFPTLVDQVNFLLYSRSRFEFLSSNGKTKGRNKCVHGCEVACQFLSHIRNIRLHNSGGIIQQHNVIRHLKNIYCDLNWEIRVVTVDTFFQMLEILTLNADPPRHAQDIPFTFEQYDGAKRSRRGVRAYRPQCLTLHGLITLDVKIFLVKVGSCNGETLDDWNQWIRQRNVSPPPFDYLCRLPTEIVTQIYRDHLHIPERHVVAPRMARNPSLKLLQISRSLNKDLLPILYGTCCFEFIHRSGSLHANSLTNPHDSDRVDKASWATQFLRKIGRDNARNMRNVKVIIEINPPFVWDYTPSIRSIVENLDKRCGFQIMHTYANVNDDQLPIKPIPWDQHTRRLSFQIIFPKHKNKTFIIEIRTKWNTEQPGTLAHETQLEIIRQVFRGSMEGLRFRVDELGDIEPL